jgi:hypothetical protein
MKQLIILFVMPFMGMNAQTDSALKARKLKFKAVQLEAHGTTLFLNSSISQSKLQQFVTNDPLLYLDFSSYNSAPKDARSVVYNSNIGARAYFTLNSRSKLEKELYAGVVYGTGSYSQLMFHKGNYDTLGVYTNTASGQYLYQVQETNDSYNFSINSNMVLMPVGLNITTPKTKRVWFGFGVEIAPGITFNYQYSSSHYKFSRKHLVEPGTPVANYYTMDPFNVTQFEAKSSSKNLNGAGFAGYVGLPLNMNLRLSKRLPVLKNTSLGVSLAPSYYMEVNKYRGTRSGFALASTMNLRYNFN